MKSAKIQSDTLPILYLLRKSTREKIDMFVSNIENECFENIEK